LGIDLPTSNSVRTELLAEQRFFVACFDRIAKPHNHIGSERGMGSAGVPDKQIETLVIQEPAAIQECAARSADGVHWIGHYELEPDHALARLVIPTIDVDVSVREGIDVATLRAPVAGHYLSSELPGQAGNAALTAQRTTYGATFHRFDELAAGDLVFITTFQGTFQYQVTGQGIHERDDVAVLDDFGDNRLTLITAHPKYSNRKRLVVVGELVGNPAPAFPYVQLRMTLGEDVDTSTPP